MIARPRSPRATGEINPIFVALAENRIPARSAAKEEVESQCAVAAEMSAPRDLEGRHAAGAGRAQAQLSGNDEMLLDAAIRLGHDGDARRDAGREARVLSGGRDQLEHVVA